MTILLTEDDKQWIETNIGRMIEASETRLLTAFHQWAPPMEMRQRTHTATLKAIDSEMEYLAGRVTKLDGGVGGKP